MKKLKRMIALVCAMALIAALAGCGGNSGGSSPDSSAGGDAGTSGSAGASGKVGVLFPGKNQVRWASDGVVMENLAKEMGLEIDVQFADDDVATQVNLMENMITKGVDAIIVCPVDGSAMGPACQAAADAGVAVISYDRLLTNTPNVTCYITFDNRMVGYYCGQYIVDELDLEHVDGPFHLELFTGDVTDNNAKMTLEGAMDALQPYIDAGKLVIPSGQTALEQVQTVNWDAGEAQNRMENLLSRYYTDKNVDAIMSTYGGMSLGVVTALKAAGYGTAAKPLPLITAQDAELPTMKSIAADEISMSILKDSRVVAQTAMKAAQCVINGEEIPINDTETYDNGAFVVPTYLCDITVFDKDNMQEVTVDSGLFTYEEVYG